MAANVWTNANDSTTTTWAAGGNTSTAWEESSGSNNLLVDNSQQYSTIGTFSSVAKATTSIVGSKYHLLDNKAFEFGTHEDFQLSYSAPNNGMVLNSRALSVSDKLLSIQNGASEIFGITYEGIMKFSTIGTLPSVSETGRLAFSSNDLYISKD